MTWTAHIDGGARGNPGPASAGVQIHDDAGDLVFAAGLFLGHGTNNEAEYHGLLFALDLLGAAAARDIRIHSDSELLVRQMEGRYRVQAPNLAPLFEQARSRIRAFPRHRFERVPRERNREADALANAALNASADVVEVDALGLAARLDRPAVIPTPASAIRRGSAASRERQTPASRDRQGAINPPAGIVVTVVKAPRSGGCPARIRAGQTFAFADTVPAGFCVHACASVIDVVLSLRTVGEQGGVQADAITMTCQQPECGAVFQVTPARSGGSLGVGRRR